MNFRRPIGLPDIEISKNTIGLFEFDPDIYNLKYSKIINNVKKITQQGARTPDHLIKSLALYRLS